ncbi:hypothetical protein BDA96_01G503500 [Sorghum bicolor]|uniref:PUM-HD domain-containing protein n=1 Tax=Sorghum bicolor TaxID=4558 RepID=A0A921V1P4_SORBI|nr:hypothetical protein BDA96_01G503500 [Sorghum bicolor]
MSGSDLRRLVAPVPVPGYLYSESGAPWPPLPNAIARQNQYQPWANQPHPSSAAVFPAPRYNPVYLPVPAVYAQQPSSSTFFFAPGYNYDSSSIPHAPIYPPWAAVYAQQPGFATAFSAPGHNNNLIPHASVNLLGAPLYAQPGAATDFSARDGNANTSAGLIAPPANSNQGATASGGPVAGVPDPLAQKNVQANVGDLATNPETSGELIFMLEQDNHEVRVLVTRWVLEDVRMVMGSHTGHAVLLALLGAVERANMIIAIEAIINGAVSYRYNGASLMEVVNVSSGEIVLKEFVRLAALHFRPSVLQRLFRCLINGWKMEQSNGMELLQHFFTTLHFDHCSIFIDELAVPRFWDMVTSRIGYMSMIVCLENAGYTEQGATLQNTIVTHTVQMANEKFGSFFLRAVIERGRNAQLEERIRERVVANLVELSMGRYGNDVVQECFVPSKEKVPSVPLLQRGLDAFLRLPDEQLRELVQNHWAGYVLRRLLQTSVERNMAEEEAMQLAERILGVGAAGDETDAELPRPAGDPRRQAVAILQ